MGTGLEDLLWNLGEMVCGFFGEELLDNFFGVSGGVAPFPFVRLSPMAFTNSLTETPMNSEKSLKMREKCIKNEKIRKNPWN